MKQQLFFIVSFLFYSLWGFSQYTSTVSTTDDIFYTTTPQVATSTTTPAILFTYGGTSPNTFLQARSANPVGQSNLNARFEFDIVTASGTVTANNLLFDFKKLIGTATSITITVGAQTPQTYFYGSGGAGSTYTTHLTSFVGPITLSTTATHVTFDVTDIDNVDSGTLNTAVRLYKCTVQGKNLPLSSEAVLASGNTWYHNYSPDQFDAATIGSSVTFQEQGTAVGTPTTNENSSANVAKFTKDATASSFIRFQIPGGITSSNQATAIFKIRTYVPSTNVAGSSGHKLTMILRDGANTGATQLTLFKTITVFDKWQEYTFDFTGSTLLAPSYENVLLLFDNPDTGLLATGNVYYFDAFQGPQASTSATTWTGATDTNWTVAGNWSAGVPDTNSNVTIEQAANQPTIATDVSINSLTIASGAALSVTANNLTVRGAIANSGTMTLVSNSNLIQRGTTNLNTGNITVNRNSNALSRLDYTIWSSPVANQNLLAFSPSTLPTRFYNYNETTNLYNAVVSPSTTNFSSATGYLIRMPDDALTAPETQTFAGLFSGVANSGTIEKAVTYLDITHGYNMIGNPYPSTIDAQTFIKANEANIESSLYFWKKINGATGSAYAVYNLLGSTSTPSSATPNGKIQVGQGFFVKAKRAANVTFTNAMRVADTQNQFFKIKKVVAQTDRVWLNMTNTAGAFSQALIGYTTDATSGVDMYDAKYFNDSPIALTSNINDEEYTIQGRPAFDVSDVVALNFKTDVAGDYTIALGQFDGVFATGQDIYLVDSKTGTETNLKISGYTFTAATGTDNTRFSLKYQKTLKVDAPAFNENSFRVYKNNGTLFVNSEKVVISNIKVFDIQGRLIAEQKNVKATSAVINNLRAKNQVLIVKITGEDNKLITKKVVN